MNTEDDVSEPLFKQFEAWQEALDDKKVAIFTHKIPDPDAVGSIMGLGWLFKKLGIEAEGFYEGLISHPQNVAMCNLLDPNMRPLEEYSSVPHDEFGGWIMVDCVPDSDNAGTPLVGQSPGTSTGGIKFNVIIDHHKSPPNGNFRGLYINLKNGSCCGTICSLIKHYGFEFQNDNDYDSKVATALMVGIATDTDNLLADSCTEHEFDGYWRLFEFRHANAMKEIIRFKRPKFWIDRKAQASKDATIDEDGIAVVGVGLLSDKHFNLIADVADEMISWASVETAICFAVVDGKSIVGSVRSINASLDMNAFCAKLGFKEKKVGGGGGREGKGSYRYSMEGLAIEEDEDDDIRQEMWATINKKETKRIIRMLKS
jgi:nanoRNase/pAp phosphatase (c-di-AMP/oligoRNAs hydrolase)